LHDSIEDEEFGAVKVYGDVGNGCGCGDDDCICSGYV